MSSLAFFARSLLVGTSSTRSTNHPLLDFLSDHLISLSFRGIFMLLLILLPALREASAFGPVVLGEGGLFCVLDITHFLQREVCSLLPLLVGNLPLLVLRHAVFLVSGKLKGL